MCVCVYLFKLLQLVVCTCLCMCVEGARAFIYKFHFIYKAATALYLIRYSLTARSHVFDLIYIYQRECIYLAELGL